MTPQVMTPVVMIEPSSWLRTGITIEQVDGVNLVKFTTEIHSRKSNIKTQFITGL